MEELVIYENGTIQVAQEVCRQIAEFERKALKIELKKKELKNALKEKMEEHGLSVFENEYIKVQYRRASQRVSLDGKKLKEELPEIYDKYIKTSNVASSITLEVK